MGINPWVDFPLDYRRQEVPELLAMLRAGDCVSLIGLSGMGKSNLMGFLAYRAKSSTPDGPICILIDCNRLQEDQAEAFFHLILARIQDYSGMGESQERVIIGDPYQSLDRAVASLTEKSNHTAALLLDSFDGPARALDRPVFNLLRALRDSHKCRLSYLLATRRPLEVLCDADKIREFNDLFVANKLWLGPLDEKDARWTLQLFAKRHRRDFDRTAVDNLLYLSGRHPGLLKAIASAWSSRNPSTPAAWLDHPAISRECELLWGDLPEVARNAAQSATNMDENETLRRGGLAKGGKLFSPVFRAFVAAQSDHLLRLNQATGEVFRSGTSLPISLTSKEFALLAYFLGHPGAVCQKDDLIKAVWPEDRIFEKGIRDDSLAQLVRRLRVKIELDPSDPRFLITVPGRGYRMIHSA